MKLRDVGEDRLLEQLLGNRLRQRGVLVGPGDDCAIVESEKGDVLHLLKTDCLVEGIHFAKGTPAHLVGWKAAARPVSDFAAMSGLPRFALVSLIIPSATELRWVKKLYRGIEKACRTFGMELVGGETSDINGPAVLSVSIIGFVEKKRWVSRSGGRAGDELFVTGRLGGSLRGHHLRFLPRLNESRWLTQHFAIHAMMDLSDGLGADLPRLARASKVGFEIDRESLPRNRGCTIAQAISDGEDYELLFAISPRDSQSLVSRWPRKFPKVALTRIGRLNRKPKIDNRKFPSGYLHFQ